MGQKSIRSATYRQCGFTLLEVMMAAVLIGLVAVSSIQALAILNQNAATNRLLTNAREVVQRNVDTALSLPCTSSSVPTILGLTGSEGSPYSDDNAGPGLVNVTLQGSAGVQLVTGTLTRIVTAVANADNADIRQITFRLNYSYRSRNFGYQLTTMRALDN